jgi:UPF0755 protein
MRKRLEKIILLLAVVALLAATHLYVTFYTPPTSTPSVRVVVIDRGLSFRMVAEKLERAGVVRDAESFSFAARILGAYKKVKAGEYEFTTAMTPMEVLESLVKGKVKRYLVTVPEGYNINEIAASLEEAGLVQRQVFIARALDLGLVKSLGLPGPTLEGYLFPDTSVFTRA